MVPRGSGAQCDISTQIAGKAHAMNPLPGPLSQSPFPEAFLLGKSQIAHQFSLCEMGAAVA